MYLLVNLIDQSMKYEITMYFEDDNIHVMI